MSTTTTFGFGRPFVSPLSYSQLIRLEQEFEIPKDQKDQLVLAGAQVEIDFRDNEFRECTAPTYEDLEKKIEELEESIEKIGMEHTTETDALKKEIDELVKNKKGSFEARLDDIIDLE
jgi:hypothetical protein